MSFPSSLFKICGFSMSYRYDRDSMGGWLLLYMRDDIPTKLLKHDFRTNIGQVKWIYNKESGFSVAHNKESGFSVALWVTSMLQWVILGYGIVLFAEQS